MDQKVLEEKDFEKKECRMNYPAVKSSLIKVPTPLDFWDKKLYTPLTYHSSNELGLHEINI